MLGMAGVRLCWVKGRPGTSNGASVPGEKKLDLRDICDGITDKT